MSTYKGSDPCTDIILDMIAEHESNGNYNAVIGNADSTEDLGVMTITDIIAIGLRLYNDGQPSTAMGRYQIIKPTMNNLLLELCISRVEKFTNELQDRLALQLLIGRGYKSWYRGEINDVTLAHGLSCEWASLPDPRNDGKSHYDGIGPNHAGATLAHVYEILTAARGLIS